MVRFYTLIFAAFATVNALAPEVASRIKTELADGKITSKVFPEFEPKVDLQVFYQGKPIQNGMELAAEEVSQSPQVSFELMDDNKQYTVVLFDAQTRVYHWIVTNIHGNEAGQTEARTQVHYTPPIPSHRYVFALFEQSEKDQFMVVNDYFDINQLTNQNRLELLGAVYMKQMSSRKARSREVQKSAPAPELDTFLNNLMENVQGFLKDMGVEVRTHSSAIAPSASHSIQEASASHVRNALPTFLAHPESLYSAFLENDQNPIHMVEHALSKVLHYHDLSSSMPVLLATPTPSSLEAPAPTNKPNAIFSKSDQNVDPWYLDGLLSIVGNIMDLHKKAEDQRKKEEEQNTMNKGTQAQQ
ncbi:PEBP-like protein [Rhizopus microsporus var. microsporus]|uniref:PEBP-like protein n=2 Tax=Rhizopus microsporus TaxID=58291 RepID=A0A2G4T9X1_RHIZD|nr:PEBP-like protein [Rhizopus microsporus ATCC 52813]ORE10241.1 PEBP-like protein [Rhizopus microsporus var. microsporus]PHZ17812.1 PEBP-like protein [Rhizopus microsporus ATCC 52813]